MASSPGHTPQAQESGNIVDSVTKLRVVFAPGIVVVVIPHQSVELETAQETILKHKKHPLDVGAVALRSDLTVLPEDITALGRENIIVLKTREGSSPDEVAAAFVDNFKKRREAGIKHFDRFVEANRPKAK